MIPAKNINELLQKLPFDIRLEVVLAELVKEEMSMDNIVVINNSLFQRNYHRDIEKAGEIEYELSRKKKLFFIVNREGIYDQLPEDLFHQPPDAGQPVTKEQVIEEIRVQEEIEKKTRLFFLPMEQEIYRQRVKLALEEQFFLAGGDPEASYNFFSDLWDLPSFFNEDQRGKLSMLMPVLHKIAGDISLFPFILSYITGYRTEVKEAAPCSHVLADEPRLGGVLLGLNLALGGVTTELQSSIHIKIFLTESDRLLSFMPGGDKLRIFEFFSHLLMSYEKDIVYELEFPRSDGFVLSEGSNSDSGRLNYTTVI